MVTRRKKSGWDCWQDCCTPVEEGAEVHRSALQCCGLVLRRGWSREGLAMPEELGVPVCAPGGAGHVSSIPPAIHTPRHGLAGSCVTHVCDCPCLEGCWCAGCSRGALWMFILYLIYSREGVVLQMRFEEGPKDGQTFAWSRFPRCISESPSVLAQFH